MAEYYLAPALVDLRNETNALWPTRDKTSDGWIGDASHAARPSGHNPDYSDGGIVRAIDIDVDGIDVDTFLNAVVGDARVDYVIYNYRIWRQPGLYPSFPAGGWATYTGSNPHTKHIHVSVRKAPYQYQTNAWFTADVLEEEMSAETERKIDETYRMVAKILGVQLAGYGSSPAEKTPGEQVAALLINKTGTATTAPLHAVLGQIWNSSSEAQRMVGGLAGWPGLIPSEVAAFERLFDKPIEVDEAAIAAAVAAAVPDDIAAQVVDLLTARLANG